MKIRTYVRSDDAFPSQLAQVHNCPKQLYALGKSLENLSPAIGVVGSRRPTPYGREVTKQLVSDLASRGVTIISGLALGIDAIAHQAALDAGGRTIAVQANGLDQIAPRTNRQLAINILKSGGAIVSEFPEGSPPLPQYFAARNRIISGLSDGVLVTEAAERSGSLITTTFALEQGRHVFVVPGNITSLLSAGTNNLIKLGATPVTSAQDIFLALGLEAMDLRRNDLEAGSAHERVLLELISNGVADVSDLQLQSEFNSTELNQTLSILEISGRIRNIGAGKWIIL